ncbi:MAG TPA: hypothetical protein DC053_21430 [Lachnoclostridium sp.]|nr:hypothetical protein [Lachnoclostridium sp.]
MVATEEDLMRLQDDMMELHRRMKSLKEMICILESGFEANNDDNCNYIISSLKVIEEQLSSMGRVLLKDMDVIASTIEA